MVPCFGRKNIDRCDRYCGTEVQHRALPGKLRIYRFEVRVAFTSWSEGGICLEDSARAPRLPRTLRQLRSSTVQRQFQTHLPILVTYIKCGAFLYGVILLILFPTRKPHYNIHIRYYVQITAISYRHQVGRNWIDSSLNNNKYQVLHISLIAHWASRTSSSMRTAPEAQLLLEVTFRLGALWLHRSRMTLRVRLMTRDL
jgi:hypothetical protein